MSEQCANGHLLAAEHAFCPGCGAPRTSDPGAAAESAAAPAASSSSIAPSLAPSLGGPPVPEGRGSKVPSWLPGVGGIVAIAVVVSVLSGGVGGSDARTLTGELVLTDSGGYSDDYGSCTGSGGYDDIRAGALVVVRDGGGETLATSSLDDGEESGGACVFSFEVTDVPDADFYEVEVSHRGGLTWSQQELDDEGWDVALSLGD